MLEIVKIHMCAQVIHLLTSKTISSTVLLTSKDYNALKLRKHQRSNHMPVF